MALVALLTACVPGGPEMPDEGETSDTGETGDDEGDVLDMAPDDLDLGTPDTCDWNNGGDTGLEGCPCFMDTMTCTDGLACDPRDQTCVACEGGLTGTEQCPCFDWGGCAHEPLECDVETWTCQ